MMLEIRKLYLVHKDSAKKELSKTDGLGSRLKNPEREGSTERRGLMHCILLYVITTYHVSACALCHSRSFRSQHIQQPEYDYMKVIDMYQLFKTISLRYMDLLTTCDRFYFFINNSLASFSVTLT